uniref:Uncharacterized protein n=1 Tax=Tetranychus urticae TaxID=32264 RepID=T1KHT6_TETUR
MFKDGFRSNTFSHSSIFRFTNTGYRLYFTIQHFSCSTITSISMFKSKSGSFESL